MDNYIITIARAYGSGGKTIGKMLAEKLNIAYYDKDLIKIASEESGINERLFNLADEKVKKTLFKKNIQHEPVTPDSDDFVSQQNLFNIQSKVIKDIAEKQSCVIVGRCADYVLEGRKNVVRVFIYATEEACIKNVADMFGVTEKEAEKTIKKIDKQRSEYYKKYTGHDWDNARNYDLCLNTSELGFQKCLEIIESYMKIKNSI